MNDAPRLRPALDAIPAYLAGRAAPAGAYKLSSNETPFPPLPGVVAAIVDAAGQVNRYPDFRSARLVAALAARHGVGEDQVAVGTGSVGVAQQVAQATAGAGDEVVFGWRSFEAYPIIVQVCGATAVTVPLRPDESHDLTAMAEAVGPRTRLVLLCSPNNPTGTAVRRAELDRFLTEVPDDVVVVLDEAYREFVRDPDVPDGVELLREHPNLVVLRTFSKAYGLAGLRVGYAVASSVVAAALRKTQVPFGVSSVAEQAALAALAAQGEVERRVQAVVDERVRVLERLRDLGLSGHDTQGNFVWLRLGDRTAATAQACVDSGVVVRPFAGEGLRVTVGEPAANDAFLAVVEGTLAPGL